MNRWYDDAQPLRLGVSACLLGQEVRYDGGHKKNHFVTEGLGAYVEWQAVCPELEVGMGVPRPSVRLLDADGASRMVEPRSGEDWTERMQTFAETRVEALDAGAADAGGLDGFVLKKGSPSCGLERIRVYRENGMPSERTDSGLFTQALRRRYPLLPLEEEGRLNDPRLRENFVERVFARNRWRVFLARGASRGKLVEFLTAHKMLLRCHDEDGYRRIGRLVGEAGSMPDAQLFDEFEQLFQQTFAKLASPKRHANVLQHAMGYFKDILELSDKQELLDSINQYRLGFLPLVVPLTLVRFHIRKHGIEYLAGQLYFDPHPRELMLRCYS